MDTSGPDIATLLGVSMVVYVVAMFGVSYWAQRQIHDVEDFLVAGRRLPLSIAWATLLATWFGAGVILTAADEVHASGAHKAGLEPLGAGLCLILAGLFFARPLWKMGLLTLVDFFRQRFGPRVELVAATIMIPGYWGWIAAQFVALAGVLHLFFDINPALGILMVAAVGTGYTLIGGMWSVSVTDAIQMVLVFLGLGVLGVVVFSHIGDGSVVSGVSRLGELSSDMRVLVPTETRSKLVGWLGVLAVSALGNIPGQDLMQRVFASKSEKVAVAACYVAGGLYIVVGAIPVTLGLAANIALPAARESSILTQLALAFLNPWMTVLFTLAVASAVLSTIDSAILSPSSVLAQNILARLPQKRYDQLQLNRRAVVLTALISLVFAYVGESAYSLIEVAYEIGLVALLVPLTLGLYTKTRGQLPAIASMAVPTALWLGHYALGWETFLAPLLEPLGFPLPHPLMCAVVGLIAWPVTDVLVRRSSQSAPVGDAGA